MIRVFWPETCLDGLESYEQLLLVGWKNDEYVVVVTALPPLDLGLVSRLLERDTLLERGSARQLYAPFQNRRLSVVGSVNGRESPSIDWLDASVSKHTVTVHCNSRLCGVVYFRPPDQSRMHYFTLKPLNLYNRAAEPRKFEAMLEFHSQRARGSDPPWKAIVRQMNCVFDLRKQILEKAREVFPELQENPQLISRYTERRRRSSLSQAAIERIQSSGKPRLIFVVMQLRNCADACLTFMERPLGCLQWSLRDLFCVFQQLHLRLNQLCYLPHQYITIVGMNHQRWHYMPPQRNAAYIKFYNMLWLAAYDWILGAYFASILLPNDERLAALCFGLFLRATDYLAATTRWLMLWPAGLKLNTQLAQFMGEVIIWSIYAWQKTILFVLSEQAWRYLVDVVALAGFAGGAALQMSVVVDLFYVLTLQMWVLYRSLARIYRQHLGALVALFRLFRGRKYNALRHRVDYGDYDMNELLMGTIVFTVLLFLFPTVMVFYSVLASIEVGVLAATAALGVALAVLNYFPLFPLLLRIRSPRRLASGINFYVDSAQRVELRSKPMALGEVFEQLTDSITGFLRETFNFSALYKLLTGEILRVQPGEVYRRLYSVLPSQRGASSRLEEELRQYEQNSFESSWKGSG